MSIKAYKSPEVQWCVGMINHAEYEEVVNWGLNNNYKLCTDVLLTSFEEKKVNYLTFWDDGSMTFGEIDNLGGRKCFYSFNHFKKIFMNKEEIFEVNKDFIMEAYNAACETWKRKLENKFPTVFELKNVEVGNQVQHIDGTIYTVVNLAYNKYSLIDLKKGEGYGVISNSLKNIFIDHKGTDFSRFFKRI